MKPKPKLAKETKLQWAYLCSNGTFRWIPAGLRTEETRHLARMRSYPGDKIVHVRVTVEEVR